MSEKEFREIFGKRLNEMLQEREKTQGDLARYLNVSKGAVSTWCLGKNVPRPEKIDMICEFFNCSRADLLNEVQTSGLNKYYFDDEAAELAQFLYENPEYKVMFDAARNISKEDIELVRQMLDRMKREDPPY